MAKNRKLEEYDITFRLFDATFVRREKGYSLKAVMRRVDEMSVLDIIKDLSVADVGGVRGGSLVGWLEKLQKSAKKELT